MTPGSMVSDQSTPRRLGRSHPMRLPRGRATWRTGELDTRRAWLRRRRRYDGDVSQVEPVVSEEAVELDVEDRAWLDERLREYRELLAYLHDH